MENYQIIKTFTNNFSDFESEISKKNVHLIIKDENPEGYSLFSSLFSDEDNIFIHNLGRYNEIKGRSVIKINNDCFVVYIKSDYINFVNKLTFRNRLGFSYNEQDVNDKSDMFKLMKINYAEDINQYSGNPVGAMERAKSLDVNYYREMLLEKRKLKQDQYEQTGIL
jgi:hypothetical protein